MAARVVQKPVKLALERAQMWGPVGGRPTTVQHIQLGATQDGKLTAISHEAIVHTSIMEDFLEPCANQTRMLYSPVGRNPPQASALASRTRPSKRN